MCSSIDDLETIIRTLKADSHFWKSRFDESKNIRNRLEDELKGAKGEIAKLKKQLYGKKSEKAKSNKVTSNDDPKKKRTRGQQKENDQPTRRNYDHLPSEVEDYVFDSSCKCSKCGLKFGEFGITTESEVLEIEVKPYRRVIRREKKIKACQCDGGQQVMTAPAPPKLIPRSRIGMSIWIEILISKYQFGQPLNRTINYFAPLGLDLALGTITGGLQQLKIYLEPIYEAIRTRCLQAEHWHADETRWSVFEKPEGKFGTRWYLWLFESPDTAMFVMDPSRSAKVIENFFGEDPSGTLMVDRYNAYQCFERKNENVHLSFCWAHIRRDFLDYAKTSPEDEAWAFDWVEEIRSLYKTFHDRANEPSLDSCQLLLVKQCSRMKRKFSRQRKTKTLCHGQKHLLNILSSNWVKLTRFVLNSELPMDNNEAERTLRTAVIGRKNFYGSGAIWSAKLSSYCYSIFKTLSMNGINIRTWLESYLGACANSSGPPLETLDLYLPWKTKLISQTV